MTPSRRFAAALVALALVAVAAFFLGIHQGQSDSRAAAAADAATGTTPPANDDPANAVAAGGEAGATPAATTTFVPPPGDSDVATVIDLLQPRADAGDAGAACRVALELLACDDAAGQVAAMAASENGGAQFGGGGDAGSEEVLRLIEDINLRALARHEACAAVPAELRARSDAYLKAAARAGNVEAMLRYADGAHLLGRTEHDLMADPDFDDWRRDAPAMLQRLLRAGEPEAVFLLQAGTSGAPGPLPGLIADDPVLAQAYADLLARIGGPVRLPDPDMATADRQRAEQLAADWHREYFHGRRFPDGAALRRLAWTPTWNGAESRIPCVD